MAWRVTNGNNYADIHVNSGELTYGGTICGGVPTSCSIPTTSYTVTYELEDGDGDNFDRYSDACGNLKVTVTADSCNQECFVMWFNNNNGNYSYNQVLKDNSIFDIKNVDECNHVIIVDNSEGGNPIHVGGQSFETSGYTDSGFPAIAPTPWQSYTGNVYTSGAPYEGHKFKYHVKEEKDSIPSSFLNGNSELRELYFPTVGHVISGIGHNAFANCIGLSAVTFGSVERIGMGAFSGCTNLKRIDWGHRGGSCDIGSQIKIIDEKAFMGCSNIENLHLDHVRPLETIGSSAFHNCDKISSVTIPNIVKSIGDSAFENCSGLKSIHFGYGSTLISIPNNCCKNDTNLSSVTMLDNITSIGDAAFYNCSSLTSIDIPILGRVTSIGNSAFYNCTGLTSIVIPSSVTSISANAFSYCTGLTNITFKWLNPWGINVDQTAFSNLASSGTLWVPDVPATVEAYENWKSRVGFSNNWSVKT